MEMKKIERVAIMGAGSMGLGIAMVFLEHPEYQVTLYNRTQANLDAAPEKIRAIAESVSSTKCDLSRLKLANTVKDAVSDADFILESIAEKTDLKQQMFAECEQYAPATCIFASNTSVKPITLIGENLNDKTRMIGAHWWNPPYLIPLVEVVPGERTSPAAIAEATAFYRALGKKPVALRKEIAGFVVNRLQAVLMSECINLVKQGVVTVDEFDQAVTNSVGLRWAVAGPLQSFHAGGGAGGLRYFLEHIGPPFERLWKDSERATLDEATIDLLAGQASQAFGEGYREMAAARDKKQLAILKTLRELSDDLQPRKSKAGA
jgi:ketoreductase RED1